MSPLASRFERNEIKRAYGGKAGAKSRRKAGSVASSVASVRWRSDAEQNGNNVHDHLSPCADEPSTANKIEDVDPVNHVKLQRNDDVNVKEQP